MTVIVHVLFEQTQPLPEVLAPPIFALNYGRALHMAYGAEDKSVSAGHLCAADHLRSKKTAKVAGHPSYSSGIVNASFPIGANTAVWQESIQGHKGSKGRPPPKRTSNIRIQSKPIGNALGRCQRENVVARVTSKRGRKGWERVLRMSLICCTLPFRSVPPSSHPSVRAPNESEGSTREWIGARPIGDRFRSSLAKVEWTRQRRAAKME